MRRKSVVAVSQGREQCCHQVNTRTTVYTLPGSSKEHQQEQRRQGADKGAGPSVRQEQKLRSHEVGPGVCQREEPIYHEMVGLQKQNKTSHKDPHNKFPEEPSWAPAPAVLYGLITAKEVARYVPPNSVLVRPEK